MINSNYGLTSGSRRTPNHAVTVPGVFFKLFGRAVGCRSTAMFDYKERSQCLKKT